MMEEPSLTYGTPSPQRLTGTGILWNSELGIRLYFQYHPEEIVETKSLNWNQQPILGVGQPLLSYGGGDVRVLRFRVLFDAHSSPTRNGHVEEELWVIRTLTVPFDINKKPTVKVPENHAPKGGLSRAPRGPGKVAGVPPVVKIAVGGRVLRGVIQNVEIQEVLHGTTPQAKPTMACTRAWVSFDFLVIEDSRMLVHWAKHQPVAGVS